MTDRTSGSGPLRWAHCPDDGQLHLLAPAAVVTAITAGHAQTLCGRLVPATGLTLTPGLSGAPCLTCITRIAEETPIVPWYRIRQRRGAPR